MDSSSETSDSGSEVAYRRWLRIVANEDYQLFLSGLRAHRQELLEGMALAVSANNELKAHELVGAKSLIDYILGGGVDDRVRDLLGLSPDPGEGIPPYMPRENTHDA